MNVNGTPTRTIWLADDGRSVQIIDQTRLPLERYGDPHTLKQGQYDRTVTRVLGDLAPASLAFLFQRLKRDLRQNDRRKHQNAAQKLASVHALAEDQPAGKRRKHRFKAHDKGRHRRRGCSGR